MGLDKMSLWFDCICLGKRMGLIPGKETDYGFDDAFVGFSPIQLGKLVGWKPAMGNVLF